MSWLKPVLNSCISQFVKLCRHWAIACTAWWLAVNSATIRDTIVCLSVDIEISHWSIKITVTNNNINVCVGKKTLNRSRNILKTWADKSHDHNKRRSNNRYLDRIVWRIKDSTQTHHWYFFWLALERTVYRKLPYNKQLWIVLFIVEEFLGWWFWVLMYFKVPLAPLSDTHELLGCDKIYVKSLLNTEPALPAVIVNTNQEKLIVMWADSRFIPSGVL